MISFNEFMVILGNIWSFFIGVGCMLFSVFIFLFFGDVFSKIMAVLFFILGIGFIKLIWID